MVSQIVTLDFETYYDQDYSLSKMSEVDYILDTRWETICCAVKIDHHPTEMYVGHDRVLERFEQIDWPRVGMLSHNARFDASILSWRYGHTPGVILDTLSMSRGTIGGLARGNSLAKLSTYLGLPNKGTEVVMAKGKRLRDFTRSELLAYMSYCVRDADNCRMIFDHIMQTFPRTEINVIDMVMRMFTEPQAILNPDKLRAHLVDVRAQTAAIMARVNNTDFSKYDAQNILQVFSSAAKFAALLADHGVDVPMKPNGKGNAMIPALAKSDRAWKELMEDDDQPLEVQAICAARVQAKSTLEETRTAKLIKLADAPWGNRPLYATAQGHLSGACPIPLKYSGAHTHRLSGDGGFNFQNLKRGSPIKEAIEALPGYTILHRDASQIEARMLAALSRCMKLLDIYEDPHRDVYCEFATVVYGRTILKSMKIDRFVGKTCVLGLGYQTGALKLRHTLFIGQGGISVKVELFEAERLVKVYRTTYEEVPKFWRTCDGLIEYMFHLADPGVNKISDAKRYMVDKVFDGIIEVLPNAIRLPSGLLMNYPNLRKHEETDAAGKVRTQWVNDDQHGGRRTIYGGKLCENIDQALSRVVITDIARRVRKQTGLVPFLSTHDSLDYHTPRSDAEWVDQLLEDEFAIRPGWLPELPLASEGGWGPSLAAAESEKHAAHKA